MLVSRELQTALPEVHPFNVLAIRALQTTSVYWAWLTPLLHLRAACARQDE